MRIPGVEVRSVVPLGEGLDNVAYEVNGEIIVRVSKAGLRREEVELLVAVGQVSPLPVPVPLHVDYEAGVLAYRKLPGRPLLGGSVADPGRVGGQLGEFLSVLHAAPIPAPRDDHPLTDWLEEAQELYGEVAGHLPPAVRPRVEEFLAARPPAEPQDAALCHNDLGAEHILTEGGTVTGIIDWSDAARTDPARDLALVLRDLGPRVLERTLAHYQGTADAERIVFYARCSLLEDLAYGLGADRRYLEAGLAHLEWVF
ncbi:phosphotransferase family protein [Thermoactinospora rubra]|uniref:phosphotransferase family protein n=1 Tax=Thermoactinospora rubra TaxID=1088767 RepID=UPI000A11EF28|nr:aminoglycoside phosphotransferase family protein [Thermoactinospora rubra]